MEGLSKYIGLPYFCGIPFKLLEQVVDHLLRLLFVADDGRDLRLDIGAYHMDARGARLEAHPIASSLLDDLRLLQMELFCGGDHDAVARLLHLLKSRCHFVVFAFDSRQFGEQVHQISVVPDGEAGLIGQGLVEQAAGQIQVGGRQPNSKLDAADAGAADALVSSDGGDGPVYVPDAPQVGAALADSGVEPAFDGVVIGQRVYPGGQIQIQLLERKLVENGLNDVGDVSHPSSKQLTAMQVTSYRAEMSARMALARSELG